MLKILRHTDFYTKFMRMLSWNPLEKCSLEQNDESSSKIQLAKWPTHSVVHSARANGSHIPGDSPNLEAPTLRFLKFGADGEFTGWQHSTTNFSTMYPSIIDHSKPGYLKPEFCFSMGVSINGGTPKWMVYKGSSHWNGWFRGTQIYGNTHMLSYAFRTIPTHCWDPPHPSGGGNGRPIHRHCGPPWDVAASRRRRHPIFADIDFLGIKQPQIPQIPRDFGSEILRFPADFRNCWVKSLAFSSRFCQQWPWKWRRCGKLWLMIVVNDRL